MSIIDEALKGVERARSPLASGNGVPVVAAGSSAVPKMVIAGSLLAVAGVFGWWMFTQNQSVVQAPDRAELTVADADAGADSSPVQVALATPSVSRVNTESSEQVAELTVPVSAPTKTNEEVSDSEPQGVAALTLQPVESDQNGVSELTILSDRADDKLNIVGAMADEQQQLAALTGQVTSPPGTASPVGLTGSVEQLTAADNGGTETPVTEFIATAGEAVDSLTAMAAGAGESVGDLTTTAVEKSVAELTDDTLVASNNEVTAAGMAGESVSGLTELTEDELSEFVDRADTTADLAPDLAQSAYGESVEGLTDSTESSAPALGSGLRDSSQPEELVVSVATPKTPVLPLAQQSQPVMDAGPVTPANSGVSPAVAIRAALAAESAGDYTAALKALAGVTAHTRESRLLKARLMARVGEYDQSSRLFGVEDEATLDASSSFWLGFARFNLRQWQQAITVLVRAVDLNSGDAVAALYLGLAQQQAGDYRASVAAFHRARTLRPDMPEIAFNTGISWWALGEKERARGAFRHFMRITDGQRQTYVEQRQRISQSYLNSPR